MTFPKESEGIELVEKGSPAQWIEERLWPWGANVDPSGVRVGSLLPEGFAHYCRVLHPASLNPRHEPVRWSTVASWIGRTVHPLMQFCRIANISERHESPPWGSLPSMGSLPREECLVLTDLLQGFTTTPGECYFAIWDGYGNLEPHLYRNVPRVRTPGRDYLLFRGPLETVMSFIDTPGWMQSPNIWWPADRAWCMATEVDLFDTYIGGSEACIEAILKRADLESFPTTLDARVDLDGDTINI